MRVTFMGTRGNLRIRTRRHRRHTVTRVVGGGGSLMIDCGTDWRPIVRKWMASRALGPGIPPRPTAILLTHAHPDHAGGLVGGAPCPVYATAGVWASLRAEIFDSMPSSLQRVIVPGTSYHLGGLAFEVAPVAHSAGYPTIAARVSAPSSQGRRAVIFVAHDVAALSPAAARLLRGANVYIGDGASYNRAVRPRGARRNPNRREGRSAVGHASVREQLRWCAAARVGRAWFTHCGTQVLRGGRAEEQHWEALLREESGVLLSVASDGASVRL